MFHSALTVLLAVGYPKRVKTSSTYVSGEYGGNDEVRGRRKRGWTGGRAQGLCPAQSTCCKGSAGDDQALVDSEIGSHMRRLLQHPHFTLTDYRTAEIDSEPCIIYVDGLLPIGCLSISATPRKDSSLASVVSGNVLRDSENCKIDDLGSDDTIPYLSGPVVEQPQ